MQPYFTLALLAVAFFASPAHSQTFTPYSSNRIQPETGSAIYYADHLDGQPTSMGEIYFRGELTCAHATYPMGTLLQVTRQDNQQSVTVRVNDRIQGQRNFVILLSYAAADQIGLIRTGRATVQLEVVGSSAKNPVHPNKQRYQGTPASYSQQSAPSSYGNTMTAKGLPAQSQRSAPSNTDNYKVKELPAGQQGYVIQLAAFGDYGNAQSHIINLQNKGVEHLYVYKTTKQDGSSMYKAVVAIFTDMASAAQYSAQLRTSYSLDGVVTKLK